MSEIISLIIAALSTYGLSSLIVYKDGPFDVFLKLRNKYQTSAIHCVTCLSVWVSVPFVILIFLGLTWLLVPLAIVGIVILLEKL